MGFYAKGMDGRIDDPKAGWKGKASGPPTARGHLFMLKVAKGRPARSCISSFAPTRSRTRWLLSESCPRNAFNPNVRQLMSALLRRSLSCLCLQKQHSAFKDAKSTVTWSVRDLANTLKIGRHDAGPVVALLAAQGYLQHASGTDDWMTTPAGESVPDAKSPRFTREKVERAVESLNERIKQVNRDPEHAFRTTAAVPFGDFLQSAGTRVQAADVGIGLTKRVQRAGEARSASTAREERHFLSQLRGKIALLHTRPYADWMRKVPSQPCRCGCRTFPLQVESTCLNIRNNLDLPTVHRSGPTVLLML
jgi:hypothetical protein